MALQAHAPPSAKLAERLRDLLLRFPAVAAGGVRWSVLSATFQSTHAEPLDAKAFGFASEVDAVRALLGPDFYVVDPSDTDDPAIAAADEVVLVARPGAAGTWPGHYRELVDMVNQRGVPHRGMTQLLGSQIKRFGVWTSSGALAEGSWDYFMEDGRLAHSRRIKRMLTMLLELRAQRLTRTATLSLAQGPVERVLAAPLTLEISAPPSRDLLVCARWPGDVDDLRPQAGLAGDELPLLPLRAIADARGAAQDAALADLGEPARRASPCAGPVELQIRRRSRLGVASLRGAGDDFGSGLDDPFEPPPQARTYDFELQVQLQTRAAGQVAELADEVVDPRQAPPRDVGEGPGFDDPSEPPPQAHIWSMGMTPSSTAPMSHRMLPDTSKGSARYRGASEASTAAVYKCCSERSVTSASSASSILLSSASAAFTPSSGIRGAIG